MLSGIVIIRYEDSSVYEGPYVEDKWVDSSGHVNSAGRSPFHHGYFTTKDKRVYEGSCVDNHFSATDLNGPIKLTVPGLLIYEGDWCDEMKHGFGVCEYLETGDVYEGRWHRNVRFGYGQYKSAKECWVYEGEFNSDKRDGEGSMRWKDGSLYMGDWVKGVRTGSGIFLTHTLDLYRGMFLDNFYSGSGQMLYSNGSSYAGEFQASLRHGKGKLIEKDDSESFGTFKNDKKHGDFVVKQRMTDAPHKESLFLFEIRLGTFEDGALREWRRVINPQATASFISLYYHDRTHFDGVYSLLLAKNFPHLPSGLDPDNRDVRLIIDRIRREGGSLVSETPLQHALAAVKSILAPSR